MRRIAVALVAGGVLVAGLAGAATAPSEQEPRGPLYGVVQSGGESVLTRVDPATLRPLARPRLLLGRNYPVERSPDGRHALLTGHASTALRVVDLETMTWRTTTKVVPRGRIRVAAWLTADRVAALVQQTRGTGNVVSGRRLVLVDPLAGRVVGQRAFPSREAILASEDAAGKLVLLLGRGDWQGRNLSVVVVDSGGELRTARVTLDRQRTRRVQPALVIAPDGARAFVVASGNPVHEIDLETAAVARRPLAATGSAAILVPRQAYVRTVRAHWVDGGRLAFSGFDSVATNGRERTTGSGLVVVDLDDWSAQVIDATAGEVAYAGGTLLVHGWLREEHGYRGTPGRHVGRQTIVGRGVTAYDLDGRRLYRLHGSKWASVQAVRDRFTVILNDPRRPLPTAAGVYDVGTGELVRRGGARVYVLDEPQHDEAVRSPQSAAAARAVELDGDAATVHGIARDDVTRIVLTLADGSELELPLDDRRFAYEAAAPDRHARTLRAYAGSRLVTTVTLARVLPSCGGASGPCGAAATGNSSAFAVLSSRAGASFAEIDPRTLQPRRQLRVGSDGWPAALSADGTLAAFGASRHGRVRVIDTATMREHVSFDLGGRDSQTRGLFWLGPRRLAVLSQRFRRADRRAVSERRLVIVDPRAKRVVARVRLPIGRAVTGMRAAGDRVVLLLRNSNGRGTSVTLVVGDAEGNVRQREITLPTRSGVLPAVQLTVEPATSRAFVFCWRSRLGTPPVMVIDLDTLEVRAQPISVEGADFDPPSIIGPYAQAFGERGVLLSGALVPVLRDGSHAPPGGIFLLDTRTFVVRQLHPHAIHFTVADGRAYMWGFGSEPGFGGRGVGLDAYDTGGQRLYELFGTRTFSRFVAAGRFGHLISRAGRQFVVDLERGRTIGSRRAQAANVEVLAPAEPPPPARKSAAANRRDGDLRAFRRPARPSDALPARFGYPERSVVDSRRVARYVDGRGRLARLFVAKTTRGELCHILIVGTGAGSGCSPASSFFGQGDPVAAGSGRLFAGIAADRVARIEIVGRAGRVHRVKLSPDNGFIWNCRAYNGCTCVLDSLRSYDAAGKLIGDESWRSRSCPARRTSGTAAPADPFARVSNRGTRVTPKADSPGEREHIPRDLFLLRSAEGRAVYRIGGVRPGFTSCYATGPGKAIGRLGSTACGRSGAPGFPSRTQPLLDFSSYGAQRGEPARLLRLEGVAADAIAEVGLLDSRGEVVERVPVVDNVFISATPAETAVAVAAFDRQGRLVYRTDRPSRPAAVPPPSPRRLAGFRIALALPRGWRGEIRRSPAGAGRARLLASNRLPQSDPRSTVLSLLERHPRAQPAFRRVAAPPQLTRRDVQTRGGHAEATRRFRLKGRQFELQIAFASPDPPAAVLRQINTLLRSLEVGAIATPPAASPARPLQRGSADGVEVEVHRSGLVTFHFDTSSALYRRLQGRPLSLGCLDFDSTDPWEPNQWSTSTKPLAATVSIVINDATRPRPPYATLDPATEAGPPLAGCYVGGSQGRRWNDPRAQRAAAEIALTEVGRRFFDERAVARDLALFVRSPKLKAVRRAAKRGADAPSAKSIRSGLPSRVVALRERRQRTAPGEIGIWSDGGELVEVSARSATGKRLFIQLREGRIGDHNLGMLAFVF